MKIQFRCDFYIEYLNYAYHNVKMLCYKKFSFQLQIHNCMIIVASSSVWLINIIVDLNHIF